MQTPPVLNRIKGAASRGASPLSGVTLPTSTFNSPRPSPAALGKRRGSSSPPPAARAAPQSTADRHAQDTATPERAGGAGGEAPGPAGPPLPDVRLDTLAEFGIPPVPTGPCKPSVEAKLANFHALRLSRGLHFNDSLHASKAFRNPRIYAKLVEFVDVDETGSNWDKRIWDPKGLGADASAARIAELQKLRSEAKAAQPAGSRSAIAFTAPASSAARTGDGRNGREDRDRRDRDRERERERGGDRSGKGSRWDRERSRSPRRR
ncbi:hypothetical protein JCM10449v2_003929 [Rhodotorula kratochvilovae]